MDVGSDTTVCTWNIDGDVIATGPTAGQARVHPFASADAKGLAILNIHGNFLLGQGARLSAGTSSTRGYGTAIINLYKDFSLVNGAYTTTNHKGPLSINFVGTGTQTVTMDTNLNFAQERLYDTIAASSNVIFDITGSHFWRSLDTLLGTGGGAFVVNGSLWLKDSAQLEGTPEFTLNPGGRLIIGSPDGIRVMPDSTHGNVQTTGTRTFSTGADYGYASSFPQSTGDGLPASVKELEIDNPNGVTLTSSVAVTDTIRILDGYLNLNGNVIDLGGTGTLVESAGKTVRGSGRVHHGRQDAQCPVGFDRHRRSRPEHRLGRQPRGDRHQPRARAPEGDRHQPLLRHCARRQHGAERRFRVPLRRHGAQQQRRGRDAALEFHRRRFELGERHRGERRAEPHAHGLGAGRLLPLVRLRRGPPAHCAGNRLSGPGQMEHGDTPGDRERRGEDHPIPDGHVERFPVR